MPESQQPIDGTAVIKAAVAGLEMVLDVGAGPGKWGRELAGVVRFIDALEAWPATAEELKRSGLYHEVICLDLREFDGWDSYPAVILGDVLEHLPRADAVKFIERLKKSTCRVFLTVPVSRCVQCGVPFGNPFETHLDQWYHYDLFLAGWRLLHVGANESGSVIIGSYELARGVAS